MVIIKPKLVETLVSLLSFMILFLMQANKVHSFFNFTFESFNPNPDGLIYQGDARVLPGSRVLSLAGVDSSGNSKSASVGRVLYSTPVPLWVSGQNTIFTTTIEFVIRSTNGASEGIAFFLAPVGTTIPDHSIGGNLGIYNGTHNPSILAVEFDTNYDVGWDPTYRHIGINVESRYSRSDTRFDGGTGQKVTARITYDSSHNNIVVIANSGSQSIYFSYVVGNLRAIIPGQVQVGIASSTGLHNTTVGIPEVSYWFFACLLGCEPVNDNNKNKETYFQ